MDGRKERRMSVLIKGMEKPEHCGYCRFRYDGICHALQKTQYSMNECPIVVIDDAGLNDTISRQAAIDVADYTDYTGLAIEDVKKVTDEVVKGLKRLPSAQSEIKPIEYRDCANAMLRMWMDGVVTDGEYGRIMDKLNAYWRAKNG